MSKTDFAGRPLQVNQTGPNFGHSKAALNKWDASVTWWPIRETSGKSMKREMEMDGLKKGRILIAFDSSGQCRGAGAIIGEARTGGYGSIMVVRRGISGVHVFSCGVFASILSSLPRNRRCE